MTDLVAFLRDRLAEDEQAALATTPVPGPGRWTAAADRQAWHSAQDELVFVQGQKECESESEAHWAELAIVFSARWQDEAEANLLFIARNDPARVLAEVAAKRRLLDYLQDVLANWMDAGEEVVAQHVLCLLAEPYQDHPDFDPSWRLT